MNKKEKALIIAAIDIRIKEEEKAKKDAKRNAR